MLEQVIGWSVELMSFDFCRVSSLSQHLLNLQMEMMISSVLSSLLMTWENLSVSWETNWRISAKRSSRRSQTEVKSWALIYQQCVEKVLYFVLWMKFRTCLSTRKSILIKRAHAVLTHTSKWSLLINPTCVSTKLVHVRGHLHLETPPIEPYMVTTLPFKNHVIQTMNPT